MNRKELVGDLVKTWQEKASDRQSLVFAVDIAHSQAIVEDFRGENILAEHLDCHTPEMERHRIITAFREHEVQVLSSVARLVKIFMRLPDGNISAAHPIVPYNGLIRQQGSLLA